MIRALMLISIALLIAVSCISCIKKNQEKTTNNLSNSNKVEDSVIVVSDKSASKDSLTNVSKTETSKVNSLKSRDYYTLGMRYLRGEGVGSDENEAIRLLTKAAELNDSDAQVQLGLIYYDIEGAHANLNKAYFWFCVASLNGSEEAGTYKEEAGYEMQPVKRKEIQKNANEWIRNHK